MQVLVKLIIRILDIKQHLPLPHQPTSHLPPLRPSASPKERTKTHLSPLTLINLIARTHLVEHNEPLYDILPALKLLGAGDIVDGGDDVAEQRVQLVLGRVRQPQRVHERDEVLRGLGRGLGGDGRGGGGAGGGGGVRRLLEGCGHADLEALGGGGVFDLWVRGGC